MINVIALKNLLDDKSIREDEIQNLLFSFSTLKIDGEYISKDIENFLHYKAIRQERSDISRTCLILDNKDVMLGYFTIAIKIWEIAETETKNISNSMRKFLGIYEEKEPYKMIGLLIGQIGRNYHSYSDVEVSGEKIMELACQKLQESFNIIGGRITWLECINHPKLLSFYERFGFKHIENYISPHGYQVFFKRTKDL